MGEVLQRKNDVPVHTIRRGNHVRTRRPSPFPIYTMQFFWRVISRTHQMGYTYASIKRSNFL